MALSASCDYHFRSSHGSPHRMQKLLHNGQGRRRSRRRRDLLDLFDQLTPKIHDLTRALEEKVEKRAQRLGRVAR